MKMIGLLLAGVILFGGYKLLTGGNYTKRISGEDYPEHLTATEKECDYSLEDKRGYRIVETGEGLFVVQRAKRDLGSPLFSFKYYWSDVVGSVQIHKGKVTDKYNIDSKGELYSNPFDTIEHAQLFLDEEVAKYREIGVSKVDKIKKIY